MCSEGGYACVNAGVGMPTRTLTVTFSAELTVYLHMDETVCLGVRTLV